MRKKLKIDGLNFLWIKRFAGKKISAHPCYLLRTFIRCGKALEKKSEEGEKGASSLNEAARRINEIARKPRTLNNMTIQIRRSRNFIVPHISRKAKFAGPCSRKWKKRGRREKCEYETVATVPARPSHLRGAKFRARETGNKCTETFIETKVFVHFPSDLSLYQFFFKFNTFKYSFMLILFLSSRILIVTNLPASSVS